MILSSKQHQELVKALKEIQKMSSTMAEWGDLDYREEAQKITKLTKSQLKIFNPPKK